MPTPVDYKKPKRLGVYEGGGYSATGIYRPWPNCLMNNLHEIEEFCPVCTYGITRMIDWLCE